MKNKQKLVLIIGTTIILITILLWQSSGWELFTKTEVIVEDPKKMFDLDGSQFGNKFVWGLDLTLVISGFTLIVGGYIFSKLKK